MRAILLALVFVVWAAEGRRLQHASEQSDDRSIGATSDGRHEHVDSAKSFANLLTAFNPALQSMAAGVAQAQPLSLSQDLNARRAAVIKAGLDLHDLQPLIECSSAGSWPAVEQCLAQAEPWLSLNDNGDLTISESAQNGFAGGTFGVVFTLLAVQLRKGDVKDRLKCIYCDGTGKITCGRCFSTGSQNYIGEDGTPISKPCPTCETTGKVQCLNCQGSGRSVPEDILRRLGDEEEGFSEEDLVGLFDDVPVLPGKAKAPPGKAKVEVLTAINNSEKPQ